MSQSMVNVVSLDGEPAIRRPMWALPSPPQRRPGAGARLA
jgi:hypothetical protein